MERQLLIDKSRRIMCLDEFSNFIPKLYFQMNEIEKILGATTDWTADLVAPMHSILRGLSERGNSHTVLTNRLRSICKLVLLIYLQNASALFRAQMHQRNLFMNVNTL